MRLYPVKITYTLHTSNPSYSERCQVYFLWQSWRSLYRQVHGREAPAECCTGRTALTIPVDWKKKVSNHFNKRICLPIQTNLNLFKICAYSFEIWKSGLNMSSYKATPLPFYFEGQDFQTYQNHLLQSYNHSHWKFSYLQCSELLIQICLVRTSDGSDSHLCVRQILVQYHPSPAIPSDNSQSL